MFYVNTGLCPEGLLFMSFGMMQNVHPRFADRKYVQYFRSVSFSL